MKYIAVLSFLVLICIFGYVVLRNKTLPTRSGRLSVSVSFYPLAYFTQRIGGDHVTVYTITPSGVEPHDYEPTMQDIVHIEQSRLLILNGKGLESWGDKIRDTIAGSGTKIVVAGSSVDSQTLIEDGIAKIDPHIWLSPVLAQQEVIAIEKSLSAVDPAYSAYYAQRAQQLIRDIAAVDAAYKTGLKRCDRRDFITSHAAFGYLAFAYGLHQESIAGLSPQEEPSAKQLIAVTNFAKAHHIRYIFFETFANPKLSDTIAQEVGAQTLVLDPIEHISPDAVREGKTYLSLMRDNLNNLQIALGCHE